MKVLVQPVKNLLKKGMQVAHERFIKWTALLNPPRLKILSSIYPGVKQSLLPKMLYSANNSLLSKGKLNYYISNR